MTNRKIGTQFEAFFCEQLYFNGYWVHNLAQNQAGQPADVIAVKNRKAYLIDCKVCSGTSFPLSRVEENQELSMKLWYESGNGTGWFAFQIESEIYMMSHTAVKGYGKNRSRLSINDIWTMGIPLKEWMNKCR